MKKISFPLLALCLTWLVGCASSSSPPPTGSVQFVASLPQVLATPVTRVTVSVTASDFSPISVDLTSTNGTWGGTLGNLPAGSNRTFVAQAFDSSGTARFQGQASGVTLEANKTTAVGLTLQDLSPPAPYGNEAPILDSLVASPTTLQTGGTLSLTATAHDPNAGDTLTYAWTASKGTFSAATSATSSWTAPSTLGIQTLILTVTDSQGAAVSVSLAINVVSGAATGGASLTVAFNVWPTVSKVSATLNRLDAGQSTSVSALASDPDGDPLSYQWTASCSGTWTNATSSTTAFAPSSVPASACNNCRLTVTVQDGRGGQTVGNLNLCIASSTTERFPPRFSNVYQSASAASPGQTVTFDVTASDPQSSSLTFAWASTTGTLGTVTNGISTSRSTWTAPACAVSGTTPGIAATATNAYNMAVSQSFSVTGLPACATGWASTGSLASARHLHTATLLPNGKVLIVGGNNGIDYLPSAEVYDPSTGSWSTTGSMAVARAFHTATLLNNGKVLVSGGFASGDVASAEVYDPATGSWSTTGSMAVARAFHTATLLNNGKVLIAGGYNHTNGTLSSAAVYDPATGAWSTTGPMLSAHAYHMATRLNNGRVLVSGSYYSGPTSAAAEMYDPSTNSWSTTGSMNLARGYHTATLLPNGKAVVAGGASDTNGYLSSVEVYDPTTGSWNTTGSMTVSRDSHSMTLLLNGKLLTAGGVNSVGYLGSAEIFDPATTAWSAIGSMAVARYYHTATLLNNGRVLVAGGYNNNTGALTGAELYTP